MKDTVNTLIKLKKYKEEKICGFLQRHTLFWGIPVKYIWLFLLYIFITILVVCTVSCFTVVFCGEIDNEKMMVCKILNWFKYLVPLFFILIYFFYRTRYASKMETLIAKCYINIQKYETLSCYYFKYQKNKKRIKMNEEEIKHLQCRVEAIKNIYINNIQKVLSSIELIRNDFNIVTNNRIIELIDNLLKKYFKEVAEYEKNIAKCEEEKVYLEKENGLLTLELDDLGKMLIFKGKEALTCPKEKACFFISIWNKCKHRLCKQLSEKEKSNNVESNNELVKSRTDNVDFSIFIWDELKMNLYSQIEHDINRSSLLTKDKEMIKIIFCELFEQDLHF